LPILQKTSGDGMIKVLLADRQEIVREGIKATLENHDEFVIVGRKEELQSGIADR
jgi:DNA-binding NarL/FixJ family response regulator